MNKDCQILLFAYIIGFLGDFILQQAVKYGKRGSIGWGLTPYFQQHGAFESLFIAGSMMYLFYAFYYYILRLPFNFLYLAIFGIILDFIFRKTMIFSSLTSYYNNLNYFWSAFWGAIPMMLPFLVYKLLNIN
jgi:uncharacterized membrane protein YvlD (DUF360 family)